MTLHFCIKILAKLIKHAKYFCNFMLSDHIGLIFQLVVFQH